LSSPVRGRRTAADKASAAAADASGNASTCRYGGESIRRLAGGDVEKTAGTVTNRRGDGDDVVGSDAAGGAGKRRQCFRRPGTATIGPTVADRSDDGVDGGGKRRGPTTVVPAPEPQRRRVRYVSKAVGTFVPFSSVFTTFFVVFSDGLTSSSDVAQAGRVLNMSPAGGDDVSGPAAQ